MQHDNTNWRWVSIGVLTVVILAGLAGRADYEDAVLEENAYCANVNDYNLSNGARGWPDYNNNYNEICVEND